MTTGPPGSSALEALRDWASRRASLDRDRPLLAAAAWNEGRNVTEIAQAAGVARGTIYNDLRGLGIDITAR